MVDLEAKWSRLSNFIKKILDRPIVYRDFLAKTGKLFDDFILETCQNKSNQEKKLEFMGGKLVIIYEMPDSIALSAEFYFQDTEKNWFLKKKRNMFGQQAF